MKAIMISIQPRYVADILNGNKTLEIRKTLPKCDLPIDVYIYCTKDKKYANLINRGGFLTGMVVAKFTLNKVEELCPVIKIATNKAIMYRGKPNGIDNMPLLKQSCLTNEELNAYLQLGGGYAWHIDNLVVFNKPKEIGEFYTTNLDKQLPELFDNSIQLPNGTWVKPLTRAPQSWCYVEI